MNILFTTNDLQELYVTGKGKLGTRLPPQVVTNFVDLILLIVESEDESELLKFNSLDYKALQGEFRPWWSLRIDGKHRLFVNRNIDVAKDVFWLEVIGIWDKNQLLR